MVRVWHPRIIGALDDNRLPAAHAEIHYITNALVRGQGQWWLHPETQRWYGREAELRFLHNMCVDEMLRRGMNHLTPLHGHTLDPLVTASIQELLGWQERDAFDLYLKWARESRIVSHTVIPTQIHLGTLKKTGGFNPDNAGGVSRALAVELAQYGFNLYLQHTLDIREWTKQDREALRVQVADRGPSRDIPAMDQWIEANEARLANKPESVKAKDDLLEMIARVKERREKILYTAHV